MVFITGDTHGTIDIGRLSFENWPLGKTLTKNDHLIIAGDFGLLWKDVPDKTEEYWIKWLNNKPWTTLFIDGNHENFHRIKNLPSRFNYGDMCGQVSNSIFHLRRGNVYNIEGKYFFCFGGASSIDKAQRIEGVSWWKEEEPSFAECSYAIDNLKSYYANEVDYIISHTAPTSILQSINESTKIPIIGNKWGHDETVMIDYFPLKDPDLASNFLEEIIQTVKYKKIFFGHFHMDIDRPNWVSLYHNIIQII